MPILLLILLFLPIKGWCYPNFIGKGYQACLTCHYNPFGNGALNDYGRAVSATVIADRLFVSKDTSDEDLGNRSGFFFNTPKQKWFRPSLDYRGMQWNQDIDQEEPTEKFVHMQMEANITLKFGARDQYIATFTHGIIPDNSVRPLAKNNYEVEELQFSREHYIGIRSTDSLGIYLGKMDKVFGIRVPDHNAYSKKYTNLHQYSSSTGVLLHFGKESFDLGIQVFDGKDDIEKEINQQTKGFTTRFEYNLFGTSRTGLSYLSEVDPQENTRSMYALHTKIGVGKGSSLMFEIGDVNYTPKDGDTKTSRYYFLQNHILLTRGLFFLTTFENYQEDVSKSKERYRIAPGIQYFPWQRFEFRAEIYNERFFDDDTSQPVQKDNWSYIGQVHLWF